MLSLKEGPFTALVVIVWGFSVFKAPTEGERYLIQNQRNMTDELQMMMDVAAILEGKSSSRVGEGIRLPVWL